VVNSWSQKPHSNCINFDSLVGSKLQGFDPPTSDFIDDSQSVAEVSSLCFHGDCLDVHILRSNTNLIDDQCPHRELNHVPPAEYMT
jgi:hypothetical protein